MAAARGFFSARRPWAVSTLAVIALLLAATALLASPSGFWRIEVHDSARSDGVLVFRITPEGQAATEIAVAVARGRGENRIARAIRSALREKLTEERYRVKVEYGEDVVIQARPGTPSFELELVSSTVKGVTIDLHTK